MGLRHTIAQAAGDIVSMLRTRVELFGVEFNLEKSRLFKLLGLAAMAFVFLLLAAFVATFLLIAVYWDTPHRLLVIGLIAVFYAMVGATLIALIIRRLNSGSVPFQATTQELARDVKMLSGLARHDSSGNADDDSKYRDRL